MPFGSTFQSTIISFLAVGNSPSKEMTASTIATAYLVDAALVFPTLIPGSTPLTLPGPSGIEAGFLASFTLCEQLTIEPTSDAWMPAASAIVAFWAGMQFNPLIPAPGGLLGITSTVVFPGEPSSLAAGIWTAMKAGTPAMSNQQGAALVAAALNTAMIAHLAQITGLWAGTAPGVPPIPYVFPWVGAS
jgi:hypothetical protein